MSGEAQTIREELLATQALWVKHWLRSLGVLCDCENGLRSFPWGTNATVTEVCDRCVLVEVGGIRVRAEQEHRGKSRYTGNGVVLPAVEVTDERT